MTNKEHQTKNNVEIDYSRDLAAPQLRFLFFLLLPYFSQFLSILNDGTPSLPPPPSPFTPIYRKNGIWDHGSSPRRDDAYS